MVTGLKLWGSLLIMGGILIVSHATNAILEIEAGIVFLMATVSLGLAGIIEAVTHAEVTLRQKLDVLIAYGEPPEPPEEKYENDNGERSGTMATILCLLLLLLSSPAFARSGSARFPRSSTVRMHFLKVHGLTHTPAGCQVDHIQPLMKGGLDAESNMQILCGEALRQKERTERR